MQIHVRYWSWFKDIAGRAAEDFQVAEKARLDELLNLVRQRHPRLAEARHSTLVAVGTEYQPPDYILTEGDEVSLFPPVQGG
ncbi:MAG: MoaD/ThiS family protein [Verrucomicrobiales bacterium]|nr:MoaD/ThiS family protein [Verrucomicrobiales bacterium]